MYNKKRKNMEKFADWVRKSGMKQIKVAEDLGISTSTLHEILRLGRLPNLKVAYSIEKYTGGHVTLYDWINEDDYIQIQPSPTHSKIIRKVPKAMPK